MAGPTLSRFLGLFRLRDASNAARMAAVSAAGEVSVASAQIGEVQASPTANTVLDRLKAVATALAGVLKVSGPTISETMATIAAGTFPSGVVDCSSPSARAVGIRTPSDMKGVSVLSAVVSTSSGGIYKTLCDEDGAEWKVPAAADAQIGLPSAVFDRALYLKFRPGTSATPQTASGSFDLGILQG